MVFLWVFLWFFYGFPIIYTRFLWEYNQGKNSHSLECNKRYPVTITYHNHTIKQLNIYHISYIKKLYIHNIYIYYYIYIIYIYILLYIHNLYIYIYVSIYISYSYNQTIKHISKKNYNHSLTTSQRLFEARPEAEEMASWLNFLQQSHRPYIFVD